MGLTSPALSILLAALSLGLLVAIIFGWRKLAGPGLRTVLLRSGSLLALQACILSLIFVTVNRSGEFYSSWSDLFGSDNGQGSVMASANVGSATVRPVVVTGRAPVRVPGSRTVSGTLDTVTFSGQLSGLSVTGHVFLPPGFDPAGRQRYPVIVAISNDLNNTSSPYGALRLSEDAAKLITARRLEPVVIAMLPAGLSAADQGCLNVPAESATSHSPASPAVQAATFFAQDLPGMLESGFRAESSASGWALLGDSSGGYCALQLTLSDSWVFSVAVAPDGAYSQPPGSNEDAGSPQLGQQENLQWLLRSQPMQQVSVLFTGSSLGGEGQAASFLAAARPPMRVSTASLESGGWPLDGVLGWIGAQIGTEAPAGHPSRARRSSHGVA